MKLLNHTLLYLSGSLFFIIGIWAVIFYFSMLDEVYDSIDDGLDNYKMLIIQKAKSDSSVLKKTAFDESNYLVRELSKPEAAGNYKEHYRDTLLFMQNEQDFEPVRILTTAFTIDHIRYYELMIISSMVEEDDLVADLTYALIALYVIIVISIVIINNFVLKKIWQPFYALIAQLKKFNLKTTTTFLTPATKVAEFKSLNEAVTQLIDKNTKIYNSQKQFIENASHELQTPVAICINKLELFLEEQSFTDEQAKPVMDVLQTLGRMSRLNQSLLLLSKIENRQFSENGPITINPVIKQLVTDFTELLVFKDLSINITERAELLLPINKDLAVILFSNLLKNAIVHSPKQSSLTIEITSASIALSNPGTQALNSGLIFNRFYKNEEKTGSTGLGLAIAKAIADLHNLQLNYMYDGQHNFTLSC